MGGHDWHRNDHPRQLGDMPRPRPDRRSERMIRRHYNNTSGPDLIRGAVWTDDAACRDTEPELWFTPGDNWTGTKAAREQAAAALAICRTCPVIAECLDAALELGDKHAFRGGMTPGQRGRYARKTRAKEAS